MEHYYGEDGADYVQLNAAYAKSLGLEIPWMMCQQGEGTGTAPPEDIINTCNGYYCDNWIESHAEAFPNQPHMWTENWPGWFQNWGQAVPHRPTVDVTFAVARWYAKGGTFMNYYMAFGGTTFGRHVGGPGIITSYDYDVQINEWGLEAEPKFTATRHLHEALMEVAPVVLASDQIPSPVAVALNCEQHEYGTGDNAELGCVSFLSNYGTKGSCKFTVSGTVFEVPMWSVSILKNTCDGSTPPVLLLNTRDDAVKIVQNRPQTTTVITFDNAAFKVSKESIPPTLSNPASVVSSEYPQEQLRLTGDQTDYLWYSFSINSVPEGVTSVNISYSSGAMAGSHMFAFVGGSLEATTEPSYGSGQDSGAIGIPVSFTVPVVAGDNRLDIVTVAMGLQNYGPYLEKRKAGVISNFTVSYASEDVTVVKDIDHTIGLQGEEYEFWDSSATDPAWQPLSSADCGRPFSWYRVDFDTPLDLDLKQSLAVDIVNSNSGSALGKGALWVNGFHLGRFWDVSARSYPVCETCESETYTGSYNADSCRSGCGEPSQRLYKIPQGLLRSSQR